MAASNSALVPLVVLLSSCKHMEFDKLLPSVRNDRIQLATSRPPGARTAVLERRVTVTAPPEAVQLATSGDPRVLDALVPLLKDPSRDWAAEVLLAAMTGREEKQVDTYQAHPDEWRRTLGPTAYDRWSSWLNAARDRLAWDPNQRVFIEKP
jgi:hypothetical protein